MTRLAIGMIAGLLLGNALQATAQSGYWVDKVKWVSGSPQFDQNMHLGYVAGALDTVSAIAAFNADADAHGLGRTDVGALAKAIQQCKARAQLRALGDLMAFAERTMAQQGVEGVPAAGTILSALAECGK